MPINSKRPPRQKSDRPEKPYADFPLYPHPSGKWAKKIRGKILYFGRWGRVRDGRMERVEGDGWQKALETYKKNASDLHAGRTPRIDGDDLTVADLCNRFLTAKLRRMESGELSPRSFQEYKQTTDRLVAQFGKQRLVVDLAGDDFAAMRNKAAKKWGPHRLANEITRVRSVFKFAMENGLIDRPIRFGSEFTKPSKATMRKHKAAGDKKLFTAAEVRQLVEAAAPQLKAAILLGINAGLGNADIAGLERRHIDLKKSWLDYPRVKTGLPRRVPLWPQTISAIKAAIGDRPKANCDDNGDCVFLNEDGGRMVRVNEESRTDYLSRAFGKLLRDLKINGRKGLNFYALRHTFATVGLQSGDRDACRALMGHAAHDMLAEYDETGPNDDRLRTVVEHVRNWLFPHTAVLED